MRAYVGAVDIAMMASVVDVAGINSDLARDPRERRRGDGRHGHGAAAARCRGRPPPLVGASMFGVTTPCVNAAREQLERDGYEVLVFHATGTGGRALEGLVAPALAGVLDVTTTELADEVVGGTLSAGPDRLDAAGRAGIPQAVSLGRRHGQLRRPRRRCRSASGTATCTRTTTPSR